MIKLQVMTDRVIHAVPVIGKMVMFVQNVAMGITLPVELKLAPNVTQLTDVLTRL